MNVVLGIPFRDDSEFSRSAAYSIVRDRLSGMYAFSNVVVGDSGHPRFNRAASRNQLVRTAETLGADVIVLCDADSIPEKQALHDSINQAFEDSSLHYPFNQVWELAPKATYLVKAGRTLAQLRNRCLTRYGPSQGGIWVCKPSTWNAAGGQEPRLSGWGCEDRAMIAAAETLIGTAVQHDGVLICMHHQRPPQGEQWIPEDVELLRRYETAIYNPYEMKAIINERLDDSGSLTWPP